MNNDVRKDLARLTTLPAGDTSRDLTEIIAGLKDDQVTLVRQLSQPQADRVVFGVAAPQQLDARQWSPKAGGSLRLTDAAAVGPKEVRQPGASRDPF